MGQFVGLEVPFPAAIALVMVLVWGWTPASADAYPDEAPAVAVVFGHVLLPCSYLDSTPRLLPVNQHYRDLFPSALISAIAPAVLA
jgi:hypothetical protein